LIIPAELCVRCKGYKRLCGLPTCPIRERFKYNLRALSTIKDKLVDGATPPSVIVGESKYPKVSVFYQVPPGVRGDEAKEYDDPISWWGKLSLRELIRRRSYMVASVIRRNVKDFSWLYEKEISLASISKKPVDSEILLKKLPIPKIAYYAGVDPIGPSAEAERIKVVSNPLIPKPIDKLIWDDVKVKDAIPDLYKSGIDRYTIIRALSLGMFGRMKNRKLVPTRWAITAVDSLLARMFVKELRYMPSINSVELYMNEYLGNKFTIILYPGKYVSEWIEVWYPLSAFTPYAAKPVFVYNIDKGLGRTLTLDGGFDAARSALTEVLYKRRRTASAIIIREVTPKYYASVGNWHIRETVFRSFYKRPIRFETLKEALIWIKEQINDFTYKSMMKRLYALVQRSLTEYM